MHSLKTPSLTFFLDTNHHLRVTDNQDREILKAPLTPVLLTRLEGERVLSEFGRPEIQSSAQALSFTWTREDGTARLDWTWRVEGERLILDPLYFSAENPEAVELVSLFANASDGAVKPAGFAHRRIVPGIALGPELSPIQHAFTGLCGTLSLGRGRGPSVHQQWGLPTHFFCVHSHGDLGQRGVISELRSATACIGLLDFPAGDVHLELFHHYFAMHFLLQEHLHPVVKPEASPGRPLTPPLVIAAGADSRDAMRGYFQTAVDHFHQGKCPASQWSERKRRTAFATQTNTWGAEVARKHKRFTSDSLRGLYQELCQPGDGVDMFVIDDKWESTYGHLTHCPQRLPDFEEILDEVRGDGRLVGLWAAFLRCESPESVGLTTDHMLQRVDGTPYHKSNEEGYYLYDITQPEVREVLGGLVRQFARRYRPDLIKFDFGYEIPTLDVAQPADPSQAGDRFLQRALELIVGTLREELPDSVVMYYGLSPLMLELCDTHGPDDLFMSMGEYDLEANRRYYFASVCAEFGMPVYSSAGYDWKSVPSIWFDALASGTLGSLADPLGDETGAAMPLPLVELRNQLKPLIGSWAECRIETLGANETGPLLGCTASGWLRYEGDRLVFAAIRPCGRDGLQRTPLPEGLEKFDIKGPTILASRDGADIRESDPVVIHMEEWV